MRFAVCEDEKVQQKMMVDLINENSPKVTDLRIFDCGENLLISYSNGEKFDIIFLDIRLPGMDGIEIAHRLRNMDKKVLIILVTSILDYAVSGYSIKAFDFIHKPIEPIRFQRVFSRAISEIIDMEHKKYIIRFKSEDITIPVDSILYFESFGRKIHIHTKESEYEQYRSISEVEKSLSDYHFVRIHKSYLVNMSQIKLINSSEVLLRNRKVLPMSRNRYKIVYDSYTNYRIGGSIDEFRYL